jgi:hypothetical protein
MNASQLAVDILHHLDSNLSTNIAFADGQWIFVCHHDLNNVMVCETYLSSSQTKLMSIKFLELYIQAKTISYIGIVNNQNPYGMWKMYPDYRCHPWIMDG